MTSSFGLICVAAVALCAAAEAKEGTVQPGDRGLVDVVKRECRSILWTSEAQPYGKMIDPSRLRLLRVGDIILLPDQCVEKRPSRAVRQATMRLFAQERMGAKEMPSSTVPTQVDPIIAERDEANQRSVRLQKENDALNARLQETGTRSGIGTSGVSNGTHTGSETGARGGSKDARSDVATSGDGTHDEKRATAVLDEPSYRLWRNVALGTILAFAMLFAGTWLFFVSRLRKENYALAGKNHDLAEELVRIQEKLRPPQGIPGKQIGAVLRCFSVVYFAELIEFSDTTFSFAGCPYCSENKLKPSEDNLRQHLDKHTRLRSVKKTAKEIRRLLAAGC